MPKGGLQLLRQTQCRKQNVVGERRKVSSCLGGHRQRRREGACMVGISLLCDATGGWVASLSVVVGVEKLLESG